MTKYRFLYDKCFIVKMKGSRKKKRPVKTDLFCEMLKKRIPGCTRNVHENARRLLPGDFLRFGFDGGDGFCATFGVVSVGEHGVHEHGTCDHSVHVL